jgi:hypothetical protein
MEIGWNSQKRTDLQNLTEAITTMDEDSSKPESALSPAGCAKTRRHAVAYFVPPRNKKPAAGLADPCSGFLFAVW